ncbi:MAG: beta-N-acetylhexosaminidase [Pseudomonadota bacterium]
MSISIQGRVFITISGTSLTTADQARLQHPGTGGLILFTRNYESTEQIAGLIREVRSIRSPLLIATDHEGGRVQRFRNGFTCLPAAATILQHCLADEQQACQIAQTLGWLMAAELLSVGVDFSFAPVLDIQYGLSDVIGDRAFAADPNSVARLAQAWAQGAKSAGMISVGKHFPGHGGVTQDSHAVLPEDWRPYPEIQVNDMRPFRHLIRHHLAAIMPAYVRYKACDHQPAGFSHVWLREILRQELQFCGAVLSDDLNMQGATTCYPNPAERAQAACAAGCDAVLICHDMVATDAILDALSDPPEPTTIQRLASLQGRPGACDLKTLQQQSRWQDAAQLASTLGAHTR